MADFDPLPNIPEQNVPAQNLPVQNVPAQNVPAQNIPAQNILIVDDTPQNLRILSDVLSRRGYEVRQSINGDMALMSVQTRLPDLILLDIMMPGLDGYEVCRQLKGNPQTAHVPIIFLSALNAADEKVKAFKLGAADYVTKPFHFEEIVVRIEHQLQIQQLQQQLAAQNTLLEAEKLKAEALLRNILPEAIADQLKDYPQGMTPELQGVAFAESFESATILFADIVNFTTFATQVSPQELIKSLNRIFSRFDRLTERYGLEKFITIGDAYMVAGGIPVTRPDHVEAIANMALEMQRAIAEFRTDTPFQLRIGINTGPVIAGVIGIKKFSYDLWGDAVNIASRMESQGEPGQIQVTETTYALLRSHYVFEPRGSLEVKGKGWMKTYWLMGRIEKTEASHDWV